MGLLNKVKKGEITAFLSLILLLVLALIGTVIEGARISVAKAYAERALLTSMDSVLSEYYYPLYEDYHLFLLDAGYGEAELDLTQITDIMKEYMNYSLSPSKNIKILDQSLTLPNTNLYDLSIENISIEDTKGVLAQDNNLFIHEAVGYMKYKIPANLLSAAGEKFNLTNTSAQSSEVIYKKIKLEETACALSVSMLDLIRMVEGITVDKKGIHYSKGNLIKTEDNFIKKFCVGNIDKNSLGISHDLVFNSLKDEYEQPISWLNIIIEEENAMIGYQDKIEQLREKLENLSMDSGGGDEEDGQKKSASIARQRKQIKRKIRSLEQKVDKALSNIEIQVKKLINLTEGTKKKISAALNIIPSIERKQKEAFIESKSYEEYLTQKKDEIGEEVYSDLKENSDKIKGYIENIGNEPQYNLSKNRLNLINQELLYNETLLEEVYKIENIPVTSARENIDMMISFASNLKSTLSTYKTSNLWFDYSSLKIDPGVKNPITYFKELTEKGILDLVIDEVDSLSQKEISSGNLPSHHEESIKKEKNKKNLAETIGGTDTIEGDEEESYQKELKSSFEDYSKEGNDAQEKISTSNKLLETVLLNEYVIEHFKNLTNGQTKRIIKDTALEYEQEYLLSGNVKDSDNFNDMVTKLILTRTIMNFVYLLTDKEKGGLAYGTAAALVGFTCLEPLISLTKTIILLVWAYEEAIVDTRGLLENRYVPFLKNKNNFSVKYNELLIMDKERIKAKSEKLNKEKIGLDQLNYEDYIRIFLYLTKQSTKCERALDIMQCNMNHRYEGEFLIKNGIFGFRSKAEFYIGAKFIKLPFVYKILENKAEGYMYNVSKDYSY